MYDVKEKVAIVTGGASGIGLSTVECLLAKGAKVVIGDFNEENLNKETARLAETYGDNISGYKVDVSDKEMVKAMVAFTVEKYGRLDIMVANAGIGASDAVYDDNGTYERVIGINQHGVHNCDGEAAKQMIAQGEGGAIVNVSSIMGLVGDAAGFSYNTSKWAVRGMTKSMALSLAPHNIRVNSVHPGFITTGLVNEDIMGSEFIEYLKAKHPLSAALNRIGLPEEVSSAIMLAIENTFMTGSEIVVDGGYTVQ